MANCAPGFSLLSGNYQGATYDLTPRTAPGADFSMKSQCLRRIFPRRRYRECLEQNSAFRSQIREPHGELPTAMSGRPAPGLDPGTTRTGSVLLSRGLSITVHRCCRGAPGLIPFAATARTSLMPIYTMSPSYELFRRGTRTSQAVPPQASSKPHMGGRLHRQELKRFRVTAPSGLTALRILGAACRQEGSHNLHRSA